MYSLFLSFLILNASRSSVADGKPQSNILLPATPGTNVRISLKTDHRLYKVGKAISLTYTIENIGAEGINLRSSRFAYLPDLLEIKAPSGELLKSVLPFPDTDSRQDVPLFLPSHGFYGFTVDLQLMYPPGPAADSHNFYPPGAYQIVGSYKSSPTPPTQGADDQNVYWKGQVKSLALLIEIQSLSAQEVQQLKQDLASTNKGKQLKAIGVVRFMRLKPQLPLLAQLLGSQASSLEARQLAAATLDELADPTLFETYLRYMNSNDTIIRSEMVLAIRTLWSDKNLKERIRQVVVPALIHDLNDPKFSDTIYSTLGTLGVIGDRRAIAPITKIATSHPDPEVRRVASEVLEDLNAAKN